MTTEVRMLLYSAVLGLVQVAVAAQASTAQRGTKWNMSSRDEKAPELKGLAGRLDRASKNFLETFPFFVAAVLMVSVAQASRDLTATGAMIYFSARAVYLPVYAIGIPVVRTLVWLVSIVGLILVLAPLFTL